MKKKVGSFILTEEPNYVKVSHENGSFNFRVLCSEDYKRSLMKNLRDPEYLNAFAAVFAAIQVSTIMAIQNAPFAVKLMDLINSQNSTDELSDEQQDQILKDEQELRRLEDQGLQSE